MLLSFILLSLAIILLWLPARQQARIYEYSWLPVFILGITAAFYFKQLDWPALLPMVLFGLICFGIPRTQNRAGRVLLELMVMVLSLGLGLHLFPGFHNLLIARQAQLAADSLAYSLWFNLDKTLIGLFILAWLHPLLRDRHAWLSMLRQWLPIALLTLTLVIALSLLTGYVRFDYKLPDFLFYWLWANLLFTCMAEEALFRGFLQRRLSHYLAGFRHGALFALIIAAVLFGVAHAAGGITYVLLASVAGLGYGWVYQRTQRIEASILLHFSLNSIHIIFFSYPALLSA